MPTRVEAGPEARPWTMVVRAPPAQQGERAIRAAPSCPGLLVEAPPPEPPTVATWRTPTRRAGSGLGKEARRRHSARATGRLARCRERPQDGASREVPKNLLRDRMRRVGLDRNTPIPSLGLPSLRSLATTPGDRPQTEAFSGCAGLSANLYSSAAEMSVTWRSYAPRRAVRNRSTSAGSKSRHEYTSMTKNGRSGQV